MITRYCLVLLWFQNDFDRSNNFGWEPIVLDESKLFLDKSKVLKNRPENNLDSPKRFGPDQNNLDGLKSFWTNKRTRHTSTTTWIDTQNDFCNFHTTINYILLFWCWHFKNKKKLKDWMKNWKKKKKEKQISSQSYEKWKNITPSPHPH